jgi:hypothetical protein
MKYDEEKEIFKSKCLIQINRFLRQMQFGVIRLYEKKEQ